MRKSLNAPEVLDLDNIETVMVSPPPTTDSTGNKRSNLAILAENNEYIKRIKKEKDDTTRQLEDAQHAHEAETMCTICYEQPHFSLLTPCGHLATCSECSTKVPDCTVCRATIAIRTTAFI